jgi:uncharacterized Rmd1/YagE family protein
MNLEFRDPQRCTARALLLAERLDLRSFSIADCLSTTPLTLRVGGQGGVAVLFRYGVVVFFGVEDAAVAEFTARLQSLLTNPYPAPETDSLEIRCGGGTGVQSGVVSLDSLSLESLQVVADALSKSLVLSLYENRIKTEFDRIEPLSRQLAQTGSVGGGARQLLSKIGALMLIEHRMVGRAEIGDKPETLWEHPRLGALYASLEDEFELHERQSALDRKLKLIADTAHTLAEVWDKKQLHRMEWYVIGLIAMEIVINLLEFTGVMHR